MLLQSPEVMEFKQKTLPSAKYFDDHCLLHLIPGEKDDQTIFERMKELVRKAMCTGVPVFVSNPSKDHDQREVEQNNPDSTRIRLPKTQSMIPAQASHGRTSCALLRLHEHEGDGDQNYYKRMVLPRRQVDATFAGEYEVDLHTSHATGRLPCPVDDADGLLAQRAEAKNGQTRAIEWNLARSAAPKRVYRSASVDTALALQKKTLETAQRRTSLKECRRDLREYNIPLATLLSEDGTRTSSRREIEIITERFYSNLFRSITPVSSSIIPTGDAPPRILPSEVLVAIKSRKPGTAPGPDFTPVDFLRAAGHPLNLQVHMLC
ncbi:hypothetical protein RB195_023157 [Necator americanus]|uniref:Uncharacterized protein n=1 Tax=Necator americanus TaxID=51031 RepID=A0ABR1EI27_NECAM